MDINRAGILEQAFHLPQPCIEPDQIAGHAAFPNIGEGPYFVLIAKDDIVVASGEERWVDVNQIYALAGKLAHDMQIVAKEQAICTSGEQLAQFTILLILDQKFLVVSELHAMDFLKRQANGGVGVLELGDFGFVGSVSTSQPRGASSTGTAPKRVGSWKCSFYRGILASSGAGGSMKVISGSN